MPITFGNIAAQGMQDWARGQMDAQAILQARQATTMGEQKIREGEQSYQFNEQANPLKLDSAKTLLKSQIEELRHAGAINPQEEALAKQKVDNAKDESEILGYQKEVARIGSARAGREEGYRLGAPEQERAAALAPLATGANEYTQATEAAKLGVPAATAGAEMSRVTAAGKTFEQKGKEIDTENQYLFTPDNTGLTPFSRELITGTTAKIAGNRASRTAAGVGEQYAEPMAAETLAGKQAERAAVVAQTEESKSQGLLREKQYELDKSKWLSTFHDQLAKSPDLLPKDRNQATQQARLMKEGFAKDEVTATARRDKWLKENNLTDDPEGWTKEQQKAFGPTWETYQTEIAQADAAKTTWNYQVNKMAGVGTWPAEDAPDLSEQVILAAMKTPDYAGKSREQVIAALRKRKTELAAGPKKANIRDSYKGNTKMLERIEYFKKQLHRDPEAGNKRDIAALKAGKIPIHQYKLKIVNERAKRTKPVALNYTGIF